ncbi:preprotein translocase subunit SecY [Micavibrio aeruginosavorus]|uniref:Protein translocase subunit SecY n=1 Tax=Micavibrio aeruginosavorus EPB TaxID=349215 RepID=M4VHG0_9BACT|nr:preprotein translocase subunit SecY [Micavibrio aeruginosavorus]AGH98837.1 Preprotein translocase secY subunit [Micavibrio aeruginosavorus EPB]
MPSAVEQLAKNANWGALAKATELKKRLLFVILALLVYRLGTYIPVPGINPHVWAEIFTQKGGGILDMFNMFSGGALQRMTIFALNIMPYISASIIMQLASSMSPKLEAMKKEGESGRAKINQYTRFLTVMLATVQAYGLAVGLESMQGASGSAVIDPGMFFRISTVITIVGGTVFLMWLGEQITARGIGNGISLIIFAGIVAELPRAIASTLELGRQGTFSFVELFVMAAMVVAVITFIVFMERAQRRVLVQYPKRQIGNGMMAGEQNHIPLKLNTAGVIPPIFASSLLLLPLTIVGFSGASGNDFTATLAQWLQHGSPIYMLLYGLLIAFFCFFYTAIVFNPTENADMLRKYGGFIPGIRPGKATADYLDYVLTRITLVGAAYLCLICLLPEVLVARAGMPFYLGGTSLLIVVSVTMDTVAQIHSHMIAHQYEGLLKKAKLGGRRR